MKKETIQETYSGPPKDYLYAMLKNPSYTKLLNPDGKPYQQLYNWLIEHQNSLDNEDYRLPSVKNLAQEIKSVPSKVPKYLKMIYDDIYELNENQPHLFCAHGQRLWDIVVKELGSVDCIYTGKSLTIGNYAVEHFIPYNFVSHDLIWNLIPADKVFNNSKSDKLPSLDKYFTSFFKLQRSAIEIIRDKSPKNKFLEDYLTIFSDLDELKNLPINFTSEKFKERIQPLITIASNNGFQFL